MGQDFNFIEWCDSWLTTSGVNVLQPIVDYNSDLTIQRFAIKQTTDLRGRNLIRKQKVNLVMYDENFEPHTIENIVLSDKDEINNLNVSFDFPISAIIINHDSKTYSKVRFDDQTISSF